MIPDIAASTTATSSVCTPSPPRIRPANSRMASNRSRAIPERSRTEAISTNIGTETKTYWVMNE